MQHFGIIIRSTYLCGFVKGIILTENLCKLVYFVQIISDHIVTSGVCLDLFSERYYIIVISVWDFFYDFI